jgi:hypothetical protein
MGENAATMNDPVIAAVVAGLALGTLVSYRVGRAMLIKVGGPHAGKPLVRGLTAAGGLLVLGQAIMFFLLISQGSGKTGGNATGLVIAGDDWGLHVLVALGTAAIVGTCVILGAFVGTLCASIIEELRSRGRR